MYKLINTRSGEAVIRFNADGSTTSFAKSEDNTDYQAFLKYQAEGGKVYGADEEVPDGQHARGSR
jgi:hypothetical protein